MLGPTAPHLPLLTAGRLKLPHAPQEQETGKRLTIWLSVPKALTAFSREKNFSIAMRLKE